MPPENANDVQKDFGVKKTFLCCQELKEIKLQNDTNSKSTLKINAKSYQNVPKFDKIIEYSDQRSISTNFHTSNVKVKIRQLKMMLYRKILPRSANDVQKGPDVKNVALCCQEMLEIKLQTDTKPKTALKINAKNLSKFAKTWAKL